VKRLAPRLEVVQLVDRPWEMTKRLVDPDWIVGPGIGLLRESHRLARRLARHRLHVWTVNTPQDLDLCVSLGVEAVITDRPAMALAHLTRAEKRAE
jgi:glycerophosphoryl diester phosphodiesterase